MKKKGFTLIELLAVIVILAIIALIAIPSIGNVIEKAKIGALENSVNGLIESANMYYANQSIKGEQTTETTFDFANGEQTSTNKLSYKGKVYNGKLILHANGEVAVCVDNKEHYAYKNKDSDEIMSGVGTCLYDGTTGDFSSNSSINDLRGKTVVATNITQSVDGLSTLIEIPEEGHYDTNSKISIANNILNNGLSSNLRYPIAWSASSSNKQALDKGSYDRLIFSSMSSAVSGWVYLDGNLTKVWNTTKIFDISNVNDIQICTENGYTASGYYMFYNSTDINQPVPFSVDSSSSVEIDNSNNKNILLLCSCNIHESMIVELKNNNQIFSTKIFASINPYYIKDITNIKFKQETNNSWGFYILSN